MQMDFHYYATYCAAIIAGYTCDEGREIAHAAQFVDGCTATMLKSMKAPVAAATTQTQMEMMNARTDIVGIQDITRIWSSFHFLPYDLYAPIKHGTKQYKNRYRLICKPNGKLVKETVKLAKGSSLPAIGVAMHVLADTWAHSYFAGTPSNVINDTNDYFEEILGADGEESRRKIVFSHNPVKKDDAVEGIYSASVRQENEKSIMVLGHGRAGHLPDYSYIKYEYMPAWDNYNLIVKDNPTEYYKAFCQMVYALKYLRGEIEEFELDNYAYREVEKYKERIMQIITKRQLIACADWKAFGEDLSGTALIDYDIERYKNEILGVAKEERDNTFAGQFVLAALEQKSMVTHFVYESGNYMTGFSVDYKEKGFKGIKDFMKLITNHEGGEHNDNYEKNC